MEDSSNPPMADNGPPPDDAPGTGAPPNSPAQAVPPLLQHVGAGIGALGAVLVLCGALLPTYGSGDYERKALDNGLESLLILLGPPIASALLVLGISIWAWFSKPRLWLVALACVISILAFLAHWLFEGLSVGFACFDVCPPGGVHMGTGFWLPLVGFPLGVIGIVCAASRPSDGGN